MNAEHFNYDVFLSHSAKDKQVVRAVAERLREAGLRLWFDEWVLKPGDSLSSGERARVRASQIEEGLEHSSAVPLAHRTGEGSGVRAANAFGSDWAQWETGMCGRRNLWERQPAVRDPLNQERRFLPLRLDDAPIKGGAS